MGKDKRSSLVGQTLGQYKLVEVIGQGGLATVYKAEQPALARLAAVKVLNVWDTVDNQKMLARFEQEAKATARLQHPNILVVYEYGSAQGYHYIAMEYVDQGSLVDYLDHQGRPLNWLIATRLAAEIAEALANAHRHGLIHRDVKPSNILMQADKPLLADFGLVKVTKDPISPGSLTDSSIIMGTAEYMAPEQARGEVIDARADMYSLGVILFEMAAGRLPFAYKNGLQLIRAKLRRSAPSPRSFNPDCPPELEQVILTALQKLPQNRYPDMQAMIEALHQVMKTVEEGTNSVPDIPPEFDQTRPISKPEPPPPSPRPRVYLKLEAQDKWFDLTHLNSDPEGLIIGRAPGKGRVDIDLGPYGAAKKGVSRRHARLLRSEAGWFIEDLGSKNGTYLNRKKLGPGTPVRLAANDVIHCSHLPLTFLIPAGE